MSVDHGKLNHEGSRSSMIQLRYCASLLLLLLSLAGLSIAPKLEQVNRDEIFMSKSAMSGFRQFKEDAELSPMAIFSFESSQKAKTEHEIRSYLENLEWDEFDSEYFLPDQKMESRGSPFALERGKIGILSFDTENLKFIFKVFNGLKKFENKETKIRISGVPYVNYHLNRESQKIQKVLFPILFAFCFVFLFWFLASFKHTLLIYFPSLGATGISLFLLWYFVGSTNLITTLLPLLSFVLNMAMGLHLLSERLNQACSNYGMAIKEKVRPIFFMIFSTGIGFGSLFFSEIQAISEFGFWSFILIFLTHGLHLLIVYLGGDLLFEGKAPRVFGDRILLRGLPLGRKTLVGVGTLLLAAGLYVLPEIKVQTEAAHYFHPQFSVLTDIQFFQKKLYGNLNFDLFILPGESEEIFDLAKRVEKIEVKLKQTFKNHSILSSNSLVSEVNKAYSGNAETPRFSIQYYSLLSKAPAPLSRSYQSEKGMRVSLFGPILEKESFFKMEMDLRELLQKEGVDFQIGGLYHALRSGQSALISTLGKSFLMSLVIILFLGHLAFRRWRFTFSFLFVNLAPVGISFLLLKLFGLSFNVATVMTYSISLGLIVDGSFHFADYCHREERSNLILVKRPIFQSGLMLALSFFLFSTDDFLPIREFGICLGLNLLLGTLFDLFVLPKLLIVAEQKKTGH